MKNYEDLKRMLQESGSGVFDLLSAALVEYANNSKSDKERAVLQAAAMQTRSVAEFLTTLNGLSLSDIAKGTK